jgi:hypothetical protein
MPVGLPSMWRPVIKTKIYPKIYLRSKFVERKSERVKAINRKFAECAKNNKGKPLKEFNQAVGACVAKPKPE